MCQDTYSRDPQSATLPMPGLDGPSAWEHGTADEVSMRQLRHHTKNALQRILCQVAACPGLQHDPAGRALAVDLERRINLSANLSDALFGLTQAPRTLEVRLLALGRAVVELISDGDQVIDVTVTVGGACSPAMDDVLVRIAHELVGNAVKHGMYLRMIGRIQIAVDAGGDGILMTVADDGWGPCGTAGRGEGLEIAYLLARQYDGTLSLRREGSRTIAQLRLLPPDSRDGRAQ